MNQLFRKYKVISMIILVLAFLGCEEDDEGNMLPAITAGFTFNAIPNTGTVSFINISENADSYSWDFGNGTTSTQINPTVTFASGTYTVSLTASNVAGASDIFEDELIVVVPEGIMVPITFDDPNVDYSVGTFSGASFEIIENPAPGGSNAVASNVGAISNSGAAFEGIFFDLEEDLDLTTEKTISIDFWSESPINTLLKLEEGTGGDVETTAMHSGSGWEKLLFTFDSNNAYSRLTFFVDGPGTMAGTFFIDNLEQIETPAPPFDSGLLTNGDFEAGVEPWIGNGANIVTDGGNSFNQVDVQTAGNPFDVNLSQVVEITQGTNYILTFDASSDRARTMLAGIGLNEAPFSNTAPSVNLTTETQTFTLQLAANDFGSANSRILFDMGADVGVVVIDNVSLVEGGDGSDTNGGGAGFDSGLLTNGDFEAGVTPWIGNGANVVTEGGNSYNQVNVMSAGNPFDVNLSQVVEITQGTNYILTFDASSDRARTMLAGIGLNEAPFSNTAPSVTLTTETQTFTLQLAANDFGNANSRVLFDMGADVGVVVIDNVSLVEGGDGSDTNGGGTVEGDESPYCGTQVQAFGGDAGSDILLSVFNIDSQTMRIEIESADSDPVDVLVLPAGDWNPVPGISSAPTEISPGIWAAEFFYGGGAPENVEFNILWSKVSFGGNWSLNSPGNLSSVPFNATCDTSGGNGGETTGGCNGTLVAAASVPVNFEGCETFLSSQNFGSGINSELVANPFKTGINTSDFVLQVNKPAGSDFFAGIQNTFANNFDLTTTDTFKVKVYSTKANVTFRFELALNPQTDPVTGNPGPVFVTIPTANEWVEVEVLFTGLPGGPTAYNQLVIKPDNDQTDSAITEDGTYYIDDIILE